MGYPRVQFLVWQCEAIFVSAKLPFERNNFWCEGRDVFVFCPKSLKNKGNAPHELKLELEIISMIEEASPWSCICFCFAVPSSG